MKLLTNVEVAIEMFSHASFTFIALLIRKKDGQDHVDRLILTSVKEIQRVGPFTRTTSCLLQELIIWARSPPCSCPAATGPPEKVFSFFFLLFHIHKKQLHIQCILHVLSMKFSHATFAIASTASAEVLGIRTGLRMSANGNLVLPAPTLKISVTKTIVTECNQSSLAVRFNFWGTNPIGTEGGLV